MHHFLCVFFYILQKKGRPPLYVSGYVIYILMNSKSFKYNSHNSNRVINI